MKKLQIGNVTLDNPVILAPMAGVSDLPFRLLCREMGAALVCMEMVSAKAIYYNNKNTDSLMEIHPEEVPASLQLFGSDPQILAEMAKRIEERPFSILDLNMGCPVPKVVNNGEGSALMKDPKLVEQILTALVKAINKPVTVKIRKGFDDDHVNAVEIAKIAEACGVAAVAVHGRTRAQYYSGHADWDIIAQVKDAVKIPVIGNGDVDSPEKAKAILEQTGCDGVMIGRAAEGNPWIFREVVSYLENGTIPARPTNREKRELILRHAALQLEYKGEYTGVREMRKHLSWYTVGMPHSAHFRQTINTMEKMDELQKENSLIGTVRKYIDKHYSSNIGRDEIAAAVCIAPSYLSKQFREETGQSLREYINSKRIDAAKQLMSTTKLNLTDIALQVGFENIPYFSTVFKKYCGVSPSEWKEKEG